MKITESEVIHDIKKMFDTGKFEIPITDMSYTFVSGNNRAEYKVAMMQEVMNLECLVRFANFYLQKKFSEQGEVTVTTNEAGECVLVSRQDEDHKILKVIWEKK